MDGILYINKQQGLTSFDVVFKLRKILNTKSIGHSGTLDPNAEGVLIVLIGKYTKLLPYINHDNKEYVATLSFGSKTDTLDIWGNVVDTKPVTPINKEDFSLVLNSFIGKQTQIPPMYSAKKVNGKKLYELARTGEVIERKPIDIEVSNIELLEFNPEIKIKTTVSSGTYIRTLIEDIGTKCNNYACMTSLIRTKIDKVSIDMALKLSDLKSDISLIKDPSDILNKDIETINTDKVEDIKNGKRISIDCDSQLVLLKNNEELLAVYEKVEDNMYKCKRGLW